MTIFQKVWIYKFQRTLPLVVVLLDIIPLYFWPKTVVLPTVSIFTAALYFLNCRRLHIHHLPTFLLWGLLAASVISFRYVPEKMPLSHGFSRVSALEGVLSADARRTARGSYIYELRLEKVYMQNISHTVNQHVTVFAKGEKGFWGEAVRFDKVKLGQDGISFSALKMTNLGSRNLFFSIRRLMVQAFTQKIQQVYGKNSFLAEALLTGSRDNLDPGLKEQFRRAGVSHVLALSGMHLGIIALFIFAILRRFASPRLAIWAVNGVNVLNLLMAGASPSVLRAVIKFFLASLGKLKGNKVNSFRFWPWLGFCYSPPLFRHCWVGSCLLLLLLAWLVPFRP